jgi:hypothetical protein
MTKDGLLQAARRWRDFAGILLRVPSLFNKRMLFTTIEEVKPRRDVYYSTIFALSSAALAFLPRLLKDGANQKWLFIVSILSFAITLFLVIAIHFIHILFIVSRAYYEARKGKYTMEEIVSRKKGVSQTLIDALEDAFTLMSISARLDLALLFTLLIAIMSYVVFLVINAT